jgi:hypothetical protein
VKSRAKPGNPEGVSITIPIQGILSMTLHKMPQISPALVAFDTFPPNKKATPQVAFDSEFLLFGFAKF